MLRRRTLCCGGRGYGGTLRLGGGESPPSGDGSCSRRGTCGPAARPSTRWLCAWGAHVLRRSSGLQRAGGRVACGCACEGDRGSRATCCLGGPALPSQGLRRLRAGGAVAGHIARYAFVRLSYRSASKRPGAAVPSRQHLTTSIQPPKRRASLRPQVGTLRSAQRSSPEHQAAPCSRAHRAPHPRCRLWRRGWPLPRPVCLVGRRPGAPHGADQEAKSRGGGCGRRWAQRTEGGRGAGGGAVASGTLLRAAPISLVSWSRLSQVFAG